MKLIVIFLLLLTFVKQTECQSVNDKDHIAKTITVENPIPVIRNNETISLSAEVVKKVFPGQQVKFIQVKDLKNNKWLITQSIDYNVDGIADEFLFQSDFGSNEKKEFAIRFIEKDTSSFSLVYEAFMPTEKGMEDFTWENDFIGYRFYGRVRAQEQGTGTAMDIWCKRVPELLTNKWYDPSTNYHHDTGYGADYYSAGKNQGCGGSGIFINDLIYFSKPFSSWKIIANGPVRLVFELKFTGWPFDGAIIETKRVMLDAGHYFNKIESSYTSAIESLDFKHAVGFVQREDSETRIEQGQGWIASWEFLGENKGALGTGFIALPGDIADIKKRNDHVFSFMYSKPKQGIPYYTGAVWSEFGSIKSLNEWGEYIVNQAACIHNPCLVLLNE